MLIAACLTARGGWRHGSALAVRVPPGDDAAVLGDGTAITTDALVEGVHFDDRCAPADVGYKAVAVSVSDLAAMGARPSWATLNLSVPHHRLSWARALSEGLGEALQRWNIALLGGDTTGSPGPAMLSLTLAGACVAAPLTRASARPGDELWVTGAIGLAGAGWQLPNPPAEALAAWLRPDPPLSFALALAASGLPTAAMDLSDGLGQDLPKLAAASGLAASVRAAALPGAACLGPAPLRLQLFGGEDYQLLFAAPPHQRPALLALAAEHGVRLSCIGALRQGAGCTLDDQPWPVGGFSHFSERAA